MSFVYDKINLKLNLSSVSIFLKIVLNHTNIYIISSTKQVVIDDVFHNMCVFYLPEI